jgi:hypothetical protein
MTKDGLDFIDVKFKIIGFDESYLRYFVDIAFYDMKDHVYKSYTKHLIATDVATMLAGQYNEIDFDEYNNYESNDCLDEPTITPESNMDTENDSVGYL